MGIEWINIGVGGGKITDCNLFLLLREGSWDENWGKNIFQYTSSLKFLMEQPLTFQPFSYDHLYQNIYILW